MKQAFHYNLIRLQPDVEIGELSDIDEFVALSGQGNSHDWNFDRDELHERICGNKQRGLEPLKKLQNHFGDIEKGDQ